MPTSTPHKKSVLNKLARVGMLGLGLLIASGCAGSRSRGSDPQHPANPRIIVAEPGTASDVRVVSRERRATDGPVIGSHHLSSGDELQVATYVHTYPDPIESFPRVYWADAWYYNVHGDFVFYDPYYDSWVYYYGAPSPLVAQWNGYYPYSPYYWGHGYYGAGWYWGGVGVYGYHAYGIPVTTPYHHHNYAHQNGHNGHNGAAGAPPPNPGGPVTKPSPGGPGSPMAEAPRRTKPNVDGPVRDPQSQPPPTRNKPTRSAPGPTRTTAAEQPARSDGRPGLTRAPPPTRASAPTRGAPPTRGIAPGKGIPSRAPRGRGNTMTTASGQQITTIGAPTRRAGPREARTIGVTDPFNAPAANRVGSSNRAPSWGPTVRPQSANRAAPSRAGSTRASANRSTPSRAGSRRAQPNRTTPARSTHSPGRSAPSRASGHSAPSRSSGHSAPSRSSGHSAPSRRSAPSRSSGRSAPSRSSGRSSTSRSSGRSAPSRSSGRSSSSRSSGHSSSSRSSGHSSSSRSSGHSSSSRSSAHRK